MTSKRTGDQSITRKLVLASRSPRRHELLRDAQIPFISRVQDTPEELDLRLGFDVAILQVARMKGTAIRNLIQAIPNSLVLSSDTLVILGSDILGKPKDRGEACEFLTRLSGKTHQVKTAVNFWDVTNDKHYGEVETSNVTFRNLSEVEITDYVNSGEPLDKAGAYGIQGVGGKFIANLDGNLDNVMGLSIQLVRRILSQQKVDFVVTVKTIVENLKDVEIKIKVAQKIRVSRGTNLNNITLVAVSKLKPLANLTEAVRGGAHDLGENYVQEWQEKVQTWPQDMAMPRWHLIGPLQTNKVKLVVGKVHLIHTVDRIELIREIEKRAEAANIKQKILIQIKIGNEETKHGVAPHLALELIQAAVTSPFVELEGLMTLPPLSDKESVSRGYFQELVRYRDQWVAENSNLAPYLNELSMGTSGDFLWAIEEGATIVRVGTAIFGERT